MGRVTVILNNRSYRLNCGDGDELRITRLAEHIGAKVETIIDEFGQVGDERLLLMAALMITDELFDLRDGAREQENAEVSPVVSPSGSASDADAACSSVPRIRPSVPSKRVETQPTTPRRPSGFVRPGLISRKHTPPT